MSTTKVKTKKSSKSVSPAAKESKSSSRSPLSLANLKVDVPDRIDPESVRRVLIPRLELVLERECAEFIEKMESIHPELALTKEGAELVKSLVDSAVSSGYRDEGEESIFNERKALVDYIRGLEAQASKYRDHLKTKAKAKAK